MGTQRVVVIGGGIAGASAAFALLSGDDTPEVILVEAESQLGQHTTGRSAAQLIENYGAGPIRPLTQAGLPFFRHPPNDLVDAPLVSPRQMLMVLDDAQSPLADEVMATDDGSVATLVEIDPAAACELVPAGLRAGVPQRRRDDRDLDPSRCRKTRRRWLDCRDDGRSYRR